MSSVTASKESAQLKLTPFEEYMLFDDSPEYPMTGFFRLRFSSRLDFGAMDAAIQTTLARHPLIRSKVCHNPRAGYHWVEQECTSVKLEPWSADSENDYPAGSFIDLRMSVGTRIWLVDRLGAHDLVVQIHHACTDALGMCQLIDDLLLSYGKIVGAIGSDVALRPLNNQRLPLRNRFGLTWGKLLRLIPQLVFRLHIVGKFFARTAVPLCIPSENSLSAGVRVFPSPSTRDLDRVSTAKILGEARSRNVTVNDLLARDLFLTINAWQKKNGVPLESGWLRFFVPINQRAPEDETLSAANIMSAVFLGRHSEQFADPDLLLRSIHADMETLKRNQFGHLFIAAHALMRRMPRLRNRVLRQDQCVSSCVLSNLGVILNRIALPREDGKLMIGAVVLDGVDFIAPIRPMTSAAFCVCTYAGRLSINLHFDPRLIPKSHANELLEMFVEKIHETVGCRNQT